MCTHSTVYAGDAGAEQHKAEKAALGLLERCRRREGRIDRAVWMTELRELMAEGRMAHAYLKDLVDAVTLFPCRRDAHGPHRRRESAGGVGGGAHALLGIG